MLSKAKLLEIDGHGSEFDADKLDGKEGSEYELASHASQLCNSNLLINGDFRVWQRGNVTLTANDANWKYTADRWRAKSAYASVVSNTGGLKVSQATNVQYVMETNDYNAIAGRTVTLSYSKNGTVYVSTFTASSATVVDLNLVANDVLEWAKLEIGSISTPFAPRPYAEELALCQRYYWISSSFIRSSSLQSSITGTITFTVMLPTTMRAVPTAIVSDTADNVGYVTRAVVGVGINTMQQMTSVVTTDYVYVRSDGTASANEIRFNVKLDAEIY